MKKIFVSLFFTVVFEVSFAQWNAIDSGKISAVWLVQPNDGWTFGDTFKHWNGANWTPVIQDADFGASACTFISPNDGWVFGKQDSVYRFDGTVWTKQYSGKPNIEYCDFFDANNGFLLGNGLTYKFQNGIWTQYAINPPVYASYVNTNSLSMSDPSTAWVTGFITYNYPEKDSSYIYKFLAGQWVIDTAFAGVIIHSICFTDNNHGWACGSDIVSGGFAVIYKYDGISWTLYQNFGASTNGTICQYLYNNNLGWASVNLNNKYLLFVYDGFSWTIQDSIQWPIVQFSFADAQNGWALGMNLGHPGAYENKLFSTSTGGYGLNRYSLANSTINIYLNPAQDKITVASDYQMKNSTIEMLDINGRLLQTLNFNSGKKEINISDLNEGIYILKITNQGQGAFFKFVKM